MTKEGQQWDWHRSLSDLFPRQSLERRRRMAQSRGVAFSPRRVRSLARPRVPHGAGPPQFLWGGRLLGAPFMQSRENCSGFRQYSSGDCDSDSDLPAAGTGIDFACIIRAIFCTSTFPTPADAGDCADSSGRARNVERSYLVYRKSIFHLSFDRKSLGVPQWLRVREVLVHRPSRDAAPSQAGALPMAIVT